MHAVTVSTVAQQMRGNPKGCAVFVLAQRQPPFLTLRPQPQSCLSLSMIHPVVDSTANKLHTSDEDEEHNHEYAIERVVVTTPHGRENVVQLH